MTVKLSSLRVAAEMDVSAYLQGAQQKEAADKRISDSSRAVARAMAAQDAASDKLGAGVASLSRQYVAGYADAAKFEKAVRQVGTALDRGMDPARAAAAVEGIYRKFGMAADAAVLARQNFTALAPIVDQVNQRFSVMAEVQARAERAAMNLATAQRMQTGIASRLGIGEGVKSARDSAAAFEAAFARQERPSPAATSPVVAIGRDARSSQAALTNLSFQINDLATQVASGSSPLQAIAQQGGQIFQIWQESPNVFRDAARAVGSIITPARLAGGAVAAGALVGMAAYERWQGVIRDTNRALLGTGQSAGVTADQLIRLADSVAAVQGGSSANARSTLNAFANTGRIGPNLLGSAAALSRDTAATLGVDLGEANRLLAQSFADPVRGAEELNRALGGINATTRDYIRRLVDQGREQDAQAILIDRVRERIGRADELTSFWARSWEAVKASASGAADAIGRALDRASGGGQSREQQAATAQRSIVNDLENQKRLAEDQLRRFNSFPEAVERWAARLQDVNRQLEQARSTLAVMPAGPSGVVDPTIIARSRQSAFERGQNERRIEDGISAARDLGAPDRAAVEAVDTLLGRYNQLITARRAFEAEGQRGARFSGPDAEAMTADYIAERQRQRRELDRDLAAARSAIRDQSPGASFGRDGSVDRQQVLAGVLSTTQRINDEARLQRQEITAVTAAEREAAAIARERLDARRAGVQAGTDESRSAREQNAALNVRAQIEAGLSAAARERIASANDNIALSQVELQAVGASAEMAERNRLIQQMTSDALRERRRLYGEMATLPEAEAAAIRQVASEQAKVNQALRERRLGADLQFERDQMSRSPIDQQAASRLRSVYGDDYASHMDGANAATIRWLGSMQQLSGSLTEFSSGLIGDLRQGASLMDALTNAATRLGDRLLQMAMDQAIKGILGGLMGGGAGSASFMTQVQSGAAYLIPNAYGNAFAGGRVTPFANGGVFSNSVVTKPTLFPMANGAGLMGEAGPEAVMPLRRDATGRLGVSAAGAGGGPVVMGVPKVQINNYGSSRIETSTGSDGQLNIDVIEMVEGGIAKRNAQGRGSLAPVFGGRSASALRG